MWAFAYHCVCVCGGQRATPFPIWVLCVELRLSELAPSTFAHGAVTPVGEAF